MTAMANTPREGELVRQLPTPLRTDSLTYVDPVSNREATAHPTADFLKAFEAILLGGVEAAPGATAPTRGLEETIAEIAVYFTPGGGDTPSDAQTPDEFLPWLASWMAFTIRADLPKSARRDFLRNLTTLYRWRGTEASLKRVLEYFTGLPSSDSTVRMSETEPHCFIVRVDLSALTKDRQYSDVPRLMEIAHALIRREKPAHTRYVLTPVFPSFRIGARRGDTATTPFGAVVHGVLPDPRDPARTIEVGNTLLGTNQWDK